MPHTYLQAGSISRSAWTHSASPGGAAANAAGPVVCASHCASHYGARGMCYKLWYPWYVHYIMVSVVCSTRYGKHNLCVVNEPLLGQRGTGAAAGLFEKSAGALGAHRARWDPFAKAAEEFIRKERGGFRRGWAQMGPFRKRARPCGLSQIIKR
jgi:hypothetical protein